eukprot:1069397-Pelagomonas_calceolata.AAC.1
MQLPAQTAKALLLVWAARTRSIKVMHVKGGRQCIRTRASSFQRMQPRHCCSYGLHARDQPK